MSSFFLARPSKNYEDFNNPLAKRPQLNNFTWMNNSAENEQFTQLPEIEALAVDLALASGQILMELLGTVEPSEKNPRDLVTAADFASQKLIEDGILKRFPNHLFLGEESPQSATRWDQGPVWIVDPLDGTLNFVHGLPGFSVSIAFCLDGRPLVGVVRDPWSQETYVAKVGGGAVCNHRPIQPSGCVQLDRSLFVNSFPAVVTLDHPEFRRFSSMVQQCSTRRLGSAALNLCYVARGRLDGYWASTLKIWDIAAGLLIAAEAGAACNDLSGKSLNPSNSNHQIPAESLGRAASSLLVTATPELAQQTVPHLNLNSAD